MVLRYLISGGAGMRGLGGSPVAPVASVGALAPASISGLVLQLDANAQTGFADGDPVGTFTATVGPNATAAGTARPTYKTSILNSKSVLRFDGTTDIMALTGLDLSAYTAVTILLVTASVSATASTYALLEYGENPNNSPAGQIGIARLSTFAGYALTKNGAAGAVADFTTIVSAAEGVQIKTLPRVITTMIDKSVRTEQTAMWVNGVYGGGLTGNGHGRTNNDSGTGFAASQTLYLGARNASGVPTAFAPMDLAAVLLYSRKLTQRELTRLHLWLDDQYDVFS